MKFNTKKKQSTISSGSENELIYSNTAKQDTRNGFKIRLKFHSALREIDNVSFEN